MNRIAALATATSLFAMLALTAHAGAITVYTALEEDEISDYLKDARAALPDVEINVLRLSTGDVSARLVAEAGNPQADVVWGVAVTNMLDPRIADQLAPYEAAGMAALPAQFRDPGNHWFAATGYMAAFCVNNDRLAAKGLPMPKSWADLTNPVYKGEIVTPSPVSAGTGYLQIAAIIQGLGDDAGWELLKNLDANVAQYTESGSKTCKMARAGEYTIGASFAFPAMQSIEQGYPITMVIPEDWVGWELEASGLMKTAKNPDDAKRFLDWSLSASVGNIYGTYKEIVTIPGSKPSDASVAAGLPADLTTVLFPLDFVASAATRPDTLRRWQELTKR